MQAISDGIHSVCKILLILVLAVMSVVVFMQVLFRYVLDFPLFWTEEFARYCLIWASLLGGAVAIKRGQHIAVTYFVDLFPPKVKQVSSYIALISIASILSVILYGGIELVIATRQQISPALRIPMAIPYLAIPFGALIMLVHVINMIFNHPQRKTLNKSTVSCGGHN